MGKKLVFMFDKKFEIVKPPLPSGFDYSINLGNQPQRVIPKVLDIAKIIESNIEPWL